MGDPGDAVLTTFDNISFDSKPSTVMATRNHIKLFGVEGRFYMNILFVSACVVPVTGAKLCVCGFINSCCGTPLMLCSQHSSFDSKITTVMGPRTHIKLCDVEGRFYMNILLVSA